MKIRSHPAKWLGSAPQVAPRQKGTADSYVELAVTSNFTFLTGASHPDELVARAAQLGYPAIAITDTNTLAGVVRAHAAAREAGIPLVVGCRLRFSTPMGLDILVYPTDLASYSRLCRLLSLGKRRSQKGDCQLALHDLLAVQEGMLATVVVPPGVDQDFIDVLYGLRRAFDDDRLSLAASCLYGPDDRGRLGQLGALSRATRIPLVATNDVHYHVPRRRALQDVLTCIRAGCTLPQAGRRLLPNAERHLKDAEEMARLFADWPQAIARTVEIAQRATGAILGATAAAVCRREVAGQETRHPSNTRHPTGETPVLPGFSLDQLRYQYPHEVCPPGRTPIEHLTALSWQGARRRYPNGVPEKVSRQLDHELALIDELKYAPYFLTVHDLVCFARARGILCQGRGAAANSAVCFCLGITCVDPDRIDVLFERFISRERNEPPDIDIDFEHERREEVIQYVYQKYGRHRAALTAEVISYRGRLAVREVGKALGLSEDCVDRLAKSQDWWDEQPLGPEQLAAAGLSLQDPTTAALVLLANELRGFPRHLSQHVGGFVITRDALCDLVPIENAAMPDRTIIEWDKDDIDALGMIKVDCLGLGMLTCIRKCLEMINTDCRLPIADCQLKGDHGHSTIDNQQSTFVNGQWAIGNGQLTLAAIPAEDPAVYDMICAADTVGVFQIESRAQMSMLPRLRPRSFYDLVIEVAIVRPGPIVGDMVHPYLRRRQGLEPVEYPDEKVRAVLGKTLGVPLFQEQAMKLAMVAGGFSPDQADQLRRAIASQRGKVRLEELGTQLVAGMSARGYRLEFAQKCFKQFQGFSQYGFPESHAASFALLVYASAWLKRHFPAAFAAALLNSQPMGFYAPAQIVADAQRHGVRVLSVDVNHSGFDCRLEDCQLPIANCRLKGEDRSPKAEDRKAGADCARSSVLGPRSSAATQPAIRLGMRMVKGLRAADAAAIEKATAEGGPFRNVESLWRASGAGAAALRQLAAADAFRSMGLDRQTALWQIQALRDEPMPLFEGSMGVSPMLGIGHSALGISGVDENEGSVAKQATGNGQQTKEKPGTEQSALCTSSLDLDRNTVPTPGATTKPTPPMPNAQCQMPTGETGSPIPMCRDWGPLPVPLLPPVSEFQKVMQDYDSTGLSLRRHPMAFLRPRLAQRRIVTTEQVRAPASAPHGSFARVAGVVLVRQRPSSAAGVIFLTIEDETGTANVMVRPQQAPRFKRALAGTVILCAGQVERTGTVVYVVATDIQDISQELRDLAAHARNFR